MKSNLLSCFGKSVSIFEYGNSSNPDLLFIHGNSAHSGFFKPLINILETKYHIITLDLPGHRQSEAWEKEDFTPSNFASLFNSVLNYFNISQADAFGFSMGGLILLECFDLIPAIKKIAVAGHPPLRSVDDMPNAYVLTDDVSLYLQGHLTKDEAERVYNAVIQINDKQIKSEIKEALLETSPSFREGCLLMAQHVSDQVARLNQFLQPIAVIHAKDDVAIQLEYLKKLQINNLFEQKIQIISKGGHFIIYENPEELAAILDRFYSGI
jgi:pimeloyl-ACP methyl ester carboxylesterase